MITWLAGALVGCGLGLVASSALQADDLHVCVLSADYGVLNDGFVEVSYFCQEVT